MTSERIRPMSDDRELTPDDWAQFIKVKAGPWLTPPPALPEARNA
jgi:hypothetical protein